ncbi:MAG: hypothetical protein IJ225_03350 [Solobacterium sp.]|nr:hypothetical protein [Solobacterium sp.]
MEKTELFEKAPISTALRTMAVPTIISQMISLIYNMVDAYFIGRTGNSYMMAATTITLTLVMLNVAFSNLFGIGGGSLCARLMGMKRNDTCRNVSAFSFYGALLLGAGFAVVLALFLNPILQFLGASSETLSFARQYTILVCIVGELPAILSLTLAHLLRNAGFSSQASIGLSSGGILNMILDPLFMFVLLPKGQEVTGAALATMLSNVVSFLYLLYAYRKAGKSSPLSLRMSDASSIESTELRRLFSVGVPSMILTGLFDVANISLNILSAAHGDFVLAGMGIVMKVERIPNAINVGICQGMLPIVAYNYSSGNKTRMKHCISYARVCGLVISAISILLLELFAKPMTKVFLSTSSGNAETALITLGYAAIFLRIRAVASPMQFINYHSSYCMQAMGKGKETMAHAIVRELVFYIPFMFLLDSLFQEIGLASALPVGEGCGAVFALLLLRHVMKAGAEPAGNE